MQPPSTMQGCAAPAELKASTLFESLQAIEQGLVLSDPQWTRGDVHLWPLYKLEIYRLLFRMQAGASTPTGPSLLSRLRPAFRLSTAPPATQAGSFWLVSDGISFMQWNGRALERFCGPLWHACQRLGIEASILDRESSEVRDTAEPIAWRSPWTARAKLGGILSAVIRPDRRHIALIDAIRLSAKRAAIALPPLSARRFDSMTRAIELLAARLARAIARQRPRAVMIVSYYDVAGFAHVLAAARAGIVSVDVQHGVTGPFHPGYVGWDAIPSAAARLLPTWFWSWTANDQRLVDTWASKLGRISVHGGHPLMEAWASGAMQPEPALQGRLDAMIQAAQGRRIVLVTLQPGLTSPQHLAPWIEACRLASNVQWWVRLHPMAAADRGLIVSMLQAAGVEHWDIDGSTELPLPMLLGATAVHATHSSSAVAEAASLDIPSVVWSRYGAEHFEGRLAAHAYTEVSTGPAFVASLDQWRVAAGGSPAHSRTTHALAALKLIFKNSS